MYTCCLLSEVWVPRSELSFPFLASANYCTSPPSNFSASGRVRVGANYVARLYCSLPLKAAVWKYQDGETPFYNTGNVRNITVAGGEFNLLFDVDKATSDDECITIFAEIVPQNFSTGTFLQLNCSNLNNTMVIPFTVEGEALLVLHMPYNLM